MCIRDSFWVGIFVLEECVEGDYYLFSFDCYLVVADLDYSLFGGYVHELMQPYLHRLVKFKVVILCNTYINFNTMYFTFYCAFWVS